MPWVKIDDGFYDNPTNRAIGPKGRDLFLACLIYCTKGLTDGRIEKADLPMILHSAQTTRSLLQKLIKHGRVEDHESHLEIPRYLDYQPSKAHVLADREREREKKRAQRAKGAKAVVNGTDGRFVPRGTPTDVPKGQPTDVPKGQPTDVPTGQIGDVPRYPSRPVPPTKGCTKGSPGTTPTVETTPGGAAVDLEHHPTPKLDPTHQADLVANVRATRHALHPQLDQEPPTP